MNKVVISEMIHLEAKIISVQSTLGYVVVKLGISKFCCCPSRGKDESNIIQLFNDLLSNSWLFWPLRLNIWSIWRTSPVSYWITMPVQLSTRSATMCLRWIIPMLDSRIQCCWRVLVFNWTVLGCSLVSLHSCAVIYWNFKALQCNIQSNFCSRSPPKITGM